jgi:hypothetical protein
MPFILLLIVGAAAAAFAYSKRSSGAPPTVAQGQGTSQQPVVLDANLPPSYVQPIQNALTHETNANYLLAFGTAMKGAGYPIAGHVLTNQSGTIVDTGPHMAGETPLFGALGGPRPVGGPTLFGHQPPPTPRPVGGPTLFGQGGQGGQGGAPAQGGLQPITGFPGAPGSASATPVAPPPANATLTYLLGLPLSYWLSYYA